MNLFESTDIPRTHVMSLEYLLKLPLLETGDYPVGTRNLTISGPYDV